MGIVGKDSGLSGGETVFSMFYEREVVFKGFSPGKIARHDEF